MPRQSRIIIPDIAHHVTQRGNYRQKIFKNKHDYIQYCAWVNDYSQKNKLEMLGYCLMDNHVHFICIPHRTDSLARTFNTVHMRYAQYINRKRHVRGHLWQGRFYSCLLDEAHLYRALRYVERNPVRARMVKNAWNYPWSSASEHVGMVQQGPIHVTKKSHVMGKEGWKEYISEEDVEMVNEMRLKTMRGLVVGTKRFIESLEQRLSRSLACLSPGRPKKK